MDTSRTYSINVVVDATAGSLRFGVAVHIMGESHESDISVTTWCAPIKTVGSAARFRTRATLAAVAVQEAVKFTLAAVNLNRRDPNAPPIGGNWESALNDLPALVRWLQEERPYAMP